MQNKNQPSPLLTLLYILLGSAGIYFGVTGTFSHPFLNIACVIAGIFVLLQGLDNSDKNDHRGRYGNNRGNNPMGRR
jgi:sulfite exporter TauE/SafE